METARTPTIRSRLTLLAFAAIIPASVLAAALIFFEYRNEQARLQRELRGTARAMVQAVDRELTSLKLAAQVLATSPTLQNSDLGAFYDRAKAALEQNIGGSSIGLSDAAGRQLLNTLEPLGDQLANAANPIELSTVFKTGRPVVSDVYKDRVLNRPVVNIDVPVVHDNKIIYALSMAILPERFLNLLLDVQLPQDWIATVFDSTGTIVSRTQGMDQFLGQKAPQKLVNRIREVNEDILPYVTLEGTPVISAYSRSGVSNWTVAIAIPSAELAKQLWRSLLWVGVGSAILLLATLWVAWRISAQIAHALRRREAYLSEAESLTHMGTWAWNPQQKKMLHCSDEIFRMYALDPRKGVPSFEQIMQRIHPEDRDRVRESTVESIRSKKECLLEYRVVLPDGTVKHMQSLRRPVLDETGNVVEMVGTSLDLTDRKRAEQERERLIKLEANLSRTNRISMLGELVASLTHELRQPLTGLKASTDACLRWLVRDKPDLEKARAALSRIQRDVTRSDELMNRLRSFYIKGTPNQRRLVDVNETIRQMSALVRKEAVESSISTRLELSDRVPRIEADHVQLQQVLMNLMLNAIEAMKDLSGELRIRSEMHDDELLISVSDTGVGLPVEAADRIFDPFFTTKEQGTGMGLAITRSFVEAHGGRVWAMAHTGPGTTFCFTLPRTSNTEQSVNGESV